VTTPEPMPGSASAPFISNAAQRMWERLPQIYRILDANNAWALKRYLAGATSFAGDIDVMIERMRGARPVGPATPEPWDLDAAELARWREARARRPSHLTDPDLAEPEWLPYLAQLVGAYLDPAASLVERRDIIRFATSGYRGGTRAALADAARSALTGSRYVLVQPATRGDGAAGTVWDITLRTRASETPDPNAVLATVIRKGAKPAGVVLWHATFGTSWDRIEALYPTWTDWESRTWDQMEEVGATYAVPDNLAPNPSFETNVANWSPVAEGGGSTPTFTWLSTGGIDGVAAGRLAKVGSTGGMRLRSATITGLLAGREYVFAVSVKPSVTMPITLVVNWQNSSGTGLSSTAAVQGDATAGQWNRSNMTSRHTSPANSARATIDVVATGTVAAGATLDVDAVLFRLVTTTGG
jgi:hypothetical protein